MEPTPGTLGHGRALIIDLDGVLRIWDRDIIGSAEETAGLPSGALTRAAFQNADLLRTVVTGGIDDEAWRARIAAALDREHGSGGSQAVDAWSQPAGRVNRQVLDIIRRERTRRPVGLLTNATSRLGTDLARLGLAGEFDVVINSSEHGVAKPDPEIFHIAAHQLGRPESECLFVDDSPENVTTAEKVGMTAHHFRTTQAMEAWMTKHA